MDWVSFSKSKKITNEIINRYDKLLYLNLYENNIVTNLSNLTNLIKLNISNSSIKNDSIQHLTNLEELNISNTYSILDIKHFKKLKNLYIRGIINIDFNDLIYLPDLKNIYLISNYHKHEIIEMIKILDNDIKIND